MPRERVSHPIIPPLGMPSWSCRVSSSQSRIFLEEFPQMRAIKTMGKWKVFVRELQWQRWKVLW